MEQLVLGDWGESTGKESSLESKKGLHGRVGAFRRSPDGWYEADGAQLGFAEFDRTPDIESPLSYVGSKKKLYSFLMLHILPPDTSEIVSPFTGGGSLELRFAASGMRVYGHDIFPPMVNFFQTFNGRAAEVVKKVLEIYPIYKGDDETREYYMHLIRGDGWEELGCPVHQAAVTWAVSKQSYMGRNYSSTPIHPNFATSSNYFRDPILKFKGKRQARLWSDWRNPNFSYDNLDFRASLEQYWDAIAYLDPPYVEKEKLYGLGDQGEFPHEALHEVLAERGRFILSYGDHPIIRELYSDYLIIRPQWTYGFGKAAGDASLSEEILILSHDLAEGGEPFAYTSESGEPLPHEE